jgi:hypothetical protein
MSCRCRARTHAYINDVEQLRSDARARVVVSMHDVMTMYDADVAMTRVGVIGWVGEK